MKRTLIFPIAFLLTTLAAQAIPIITIDLGPDGPRAGQVRFGNFSDLNGPVPANRHIVFDIKFKDDNFIRPDINRPPSLSNPTFIAQVDGTLAAFGDGIPVFGSERPRRFYGGRFDFDIGAGERFFHLNFGDEVTNVSFSTGSGSYWAVGPFLPESGSTIALMTLGLVGIAWFSKWREKV